MSVTAAVSTQPPEVGVAYDIIVRFPSKELADRFCGQMSDGFGEGFCDFSAYRQVPNTTGTRKEHFEEVHEGERRVYFVTDIFEPGSGY